MGIKVAKIDVKFSGSASTACSDGINRNYLVGNPQDRPGHPPQRPRTLAGPHRDLKDRPQPSPGVLVAPTFTVEQSIERDLIQAPPGITSLGALSFSGWRCRAVTP